MTEADSDVEEQAPPARVIPPLAAAEKQAMCVVMLGMKLAHN